MRRLSPPPTEEESLRSFLRMQRSGLGLRLLLAGLPPGSTLEDARRFHERAKQIGRTPCSFLERDLSIRRD